MKELLNNSCSVMVWVISIIELCLFGFMVYRFVKTKSKITLFTLLLTFGLFYDAFIIACGTFFNPYDATLLSRLRFICHGVLIPLIFVICSEALDVNNVFKTIVWGITIVLMVAGLLEAIATKLGVVNIGGVLRMASIKGETPKWAEGISRILSFGTVIPMMIVGVVCIVKQKNPYLFLSAFLMFAFSALGPATGNSEYIFYISMYGELLMVIFLLLYIFKKEKQVL